jgi:hypothetical protein
VPALLATSVLFCWKLVVSSEYVWFDHPDMCYLEIPRLGFQAREIHAGRFPLWDPGIWMGQPLLGQTQPGPVFPLNLLFFLLPLRDGYPDFRFLNWYYVVAHAIAALSCYALCRDLRRSRAASIAGGLACAFGGFIGTVGWLDVLNGAIWTPAICLFFLRAARGIEPWRNAALCGVVLGVAWLSGHHELPMLVSYALLGGWAWTLVQRGWRRAAGPAAITFLIAGLVAAVQLWPTAEFARRSRRWVGLETSVGWKDPIPYTVPAIYSLPVKALPAMVLDDTKSHADSSPFLGVVVVSFALYAIATGWRRPAIRWMTALAAAALVFSAGAATPVHGLLYSWVPLLGKARIPVRAIHLLNFAVVVLAAYGFDTALARRERLWRRRMVMTLVGFGVTVFAASLFRSDLPDGAVLGGFVALVLAAVLGGRMSCAWSAAAVIFLMLAELYPVSTRTFASAHQKGGQRPIRSLSDHRDIVRFLRSEPSPRRLAVNDSDIPANFADWHGFDGLEGYVAGASDNILQVPRHSRAIQNLYGVTHYVSKEAPHPRLQLAFTGATGIGVWRNPEALPRVWSVHQAEQVASRDNVNPRLEMPGFDPRRTALFAEAPAPVLEVCAGDDIQLLARAPNRIRVKARMECRGLLVLSESWYPGWVARVDGAERPILETFGALRGIVLERGEHSVDVVYRPASVYGGAALTAAGLLIALGCITVRVRAGRGSPVLRAKSATQ